MHAWYPHAFLVAASNLGHVGSGLHTTAVGRIVEKQTGSRLSPASPIYRKVAAKLKKQGLDCTMGDAVKVGSPSLA